MTSRLSRDNRVRLELRGISAKNIERLRTAFTSGEHIHLADLFGTETWCVLSCRLSVGDPHGATTLHVDALGAEEAPVPVDKFGNRA